MSARIGYGISTSGTPLFRCFPTRKAALDWLILKYSRASERRAVTLRRCRDRYQYRIARVKLELIMEPRP